MKKWMFLSMVFVALPVTMIAQDDDMYFASNKSKTTQQKPSQVRENASYYSGSSRSIDEYNRRYGSGYEVLPADTGDVISFAPVEGVYPDSVSDFQMTRQMQRWDDYVPTTAYWEGYAQGRRDAWGWHSPWYYSAYYPWYDAWYYDPWYYDSWYYRPWYGGYYGWGWGYPYHGWYGGWYHHSWGHHHVYYANRQPGTIDRYGRTNGSFTGARSSNGTFSSSRGVSVRNGSRTTTTGTVARNTGTVRTSSSTSGSGNFTGNRSSSTSYGNSSNTGSFSNSRTNTSSGGSFSSGGGSFGGARSGGGGSMGGGARSGGSRR